MIYKERMSSEHDKFLGSLLQTGSYNKLYSFTRLLNGFAVNIMSEEVHPYWDKI